MKSPETLNSLQDVRVGIDELDREIVRLLGLRSRFVEAAARFKTDDASVRALDRKAAMLEVRRGWAEVEGLAPDFVEALYRLIVEHFTEAELRRVRAQATKLADDGVQTNG